MDFGKGPLQAKGSAGFAVKLDADCKVVWSKMFPAPSEGGHRLAQVVRLDAAGDAMIVVATMGTWDLTEIGLGTGTGNELDLVKLNSADGSVRWERRDIVTWFAGWLSDAVIDSAGQLIPTGYASGVSDFGGGALDPFNVYSVGFVAKRLRCG